MQKVGKSGKPAKPTQTQAGGPVSPLGHGLRRLCRPNRLLCKINLTHRGGTRATHDAETIPTPQKIPMLVLNKKDQDAYKLRLQ
jgi:hypothetical protein